MSVSWSIMRPTDKNQLAAATADGKLNKDLYAGSICSATSL